MKLRRGPAPWYRGGLRMLRLYPGLWFVWSPGGHVIDELLGRFGPYKRLIDWLVLRDIRNEDANHPERVAQRLADRARATTDLDAGRAYVLRDREFVPRDTWRPDDPIQPEGWRHDGTGWVR